MSSHDRLAHVVSCCNVPCQCRDVGLPCYLQHCMYSFAVHATLEEKLTQPSYAASTQHLICKRPKNVAMPCDSCWMEGTLVAFRGSSVEIQVVSRVNLYFGSHQYMKVVWYGALHPKSKCLMSTSAVAVNIVWVWSSMGAPRVTQPFSEGF